MVNVGQQLNIAWTQMIIFALSEFLRLNPIKWSVLFDSQMYDICIYERTKYHTSLRALCFRNQYFLTASSEICA